MLQSARKPIPTKLAASKGVSASESHWDSASAQSTQRTIKTIPAFSKRVSKKELVNMTSQLAIMTKSGVDLASALQSLVRQCTHPTLKTVLLDVHENVLGGKRVSESLGQYPTIFNETFVAS